MSQNIVYVTAATIDEARTIAKTIVTERLAACANILGAMESVYWWDGAVQSESEVSMILKTKAELVDRVIARVKALHSYDCPCVIAMPIVAGHQKFLNWIDKETV
ncbi:MAG: divalent-cation tolerance protein CutA [Rhodospirillales bacterium]|jgi:periplasmic divalent cation tolerance protein|nr:divalent-cation tolerance protein CutA [Rhodospirillaceae bacterium]MDP6429445.1 divalent-cation tolerance protein CutA [Rhodospirillales bacterium]MDP6644108.1 divalent-cation tolerance protein CutA [Rhodospirillales bacterium]MDP6843710.1 divalent-cation tolerance protein CutA [Rhodospirillales bacterium]|tara:strand:+ start:472 stop:786 length:315 start_codon:yes stop_codon:yes gene_type:complete